MKKIIYALILLLALTNISLAGDLKTIWELYSIQGQAKIVENKTQIQDKSPTQAAQQAETKQAETKQENPSLAEKKQSSWEIINEDWKYSALCLELFFYEQAELAKTVYSLAIFTKDVPADTDYNKFIQGVQGFRYSTTEICAWLNFEPNKKLSLAEQNFVNLLLEKTIIVKAQGKYLANNETKHILASANGKKRSSAQNLSHERLHVIWHEDPKFKEQAYFAWLALSKEERKALQAKYKQYSDNEEIIVKEWIIREIEQNKIQFSDLEMELKV